MTFATRRIAVLGALLAALLPAAGWAQKSDYPNKPIRVVVTFPPGGSSDAMLRLLAPRVGEKLGQQIVVENKPGAGGNIGLTQVAKAPADGYTLGLGAAGALAANASLYPQMPFDVLKDFQPITMVAAIPFVIVGSPNLPAKTLQQVIAQAKAQPGQLSMGHGGNGTAMHLSTALFEQMADIKLVQVPYRGTGPATLDVLAGQVPLAMSDLPAALQHIKAGKLVAYAVTTPQRLPMLPDVPTVAEAGGKALEGYEASSWFGLLAPAGTPADIVNRVQAETAKALSSPALKERLLSQGAIPSGITPAEFAKLIDAETKKWAAVVKASGAKVD